MNKLLNIALIAIITLSAMVTSANTASAQDENKTVRLATTTSTDNSGLLDYLLPQFTRDSGYAVQVISVGTGKALRLGMNGDVDVLLVHAPQSERDFMARGYGVHRKEIMANDFVLVGPANDPAGLREATSAADAFRKIARIQKQPTHSFISRGDDSGTHKKEMSIWKAAKINHRGAWYLEVGQGMGKSLQIADELQSYLLIDRATWIFLRENTALTLLYAGDKSLHNPYAAMAVNPRRHRTNFHGAMVFIDWLTSPSGQTAIREYAVRGTRLFIPATARAAEANE